MSSKLLPPNDDDALGGQGGGGSGSGMEQAKPTATRKVNKRTCSIVGCKNGVVQGGKVVALQAHAHIFTIYVSYFWC